MCLDALQDEAEPLFASFSIQFNILFSFCVWISGRSNNNCSLETDDELPCGDEVDYNTDSCSDQEADFLEMDREIQESPLKGWKCGNKSRGQHRQMDTPFSRLWRRLLFLTSEQPDSILSYHSTLGLWWKQRRGRNPRKKKQAITSSATLLVTTIAGDTLFLLLFRTDPPPHFFPLSFSC